MDVEEFQQETAPLKNTSTDLSRVIHQKRNLYRQSTQLQSHEAAQALPTSSVVWQPHTSHSQHPQQQRPQQPAFLQPSQVAAAHPGAANVPPLFVGFLTNDVSMDQIRNLFTSYTKAANDAKTENRGSEKARAGAPKRGKFDLRHLEDSEEESEQEGSLGKRDHEVKLKKDAK
jgi:hypothetical protein